MPRPVSRDTIGKVAKQWRETVAKSGGRPPTQSEARKRVERSVNRADRRNDSR